MAQWMRHRPTEPGIVSSSPTRIILSGLFCGRFCSRRRGPSRADATSDTSFAKKLTAHSDPLPTLALVINDSLRWWALHTRGVVV